MARPLGGRAPSAARTGRNPDGRGRDQGLATRFCSAGVLVTATCLAGPGSRGQGTRTHGEHTSHAGARLLGATHVRAHRSLVPRLRTGGRRGSSSRAAPTLAGPRLPRRSQPQACPTQNPPGAQPSGRPRTWRPWELSASCLPPPHLGTHPPQEPSPREGRRRGLQEWLSCSSRVSMLAQPRPGSQMVAAAGREEPDTPFQTDFTAGLRRAPRAPDNPICCE